MRARGSFDPGPTGKAGRSPREGVGPPAPTCAHRPAGGVPAGAVRAARSCGVIFGHPLFTCVSPDEDAGMPAYLYRSCFFFPTSPTETTIERLPGKQTPAL